MSAWDNYQSRMSVHGDSKREATYKREVRNINSKLIHNLSYHTVDLYSSEYGFNIESQSDNMISQNIAIISTDSVSEKDIYSMPDEDISLGSLIYWQDNYWLVYERDADTTLYTKAKMLQCNHLLSWINSDRQIIKQWCVINDESNIGEKEDGNFMTTRGDSRISLQIAKNEQTNKLNRESRFLIDDVDSLHKMSYQLTLPSKKGYVHNGKGTFKFILQEVTATEYDNHELGIADYYRYFTKDGNAINNNSEDNNGKKVWI